MSLTKKDFIKIYYGLPDCEKRSVICVIDNEPCSWKVVYWEVKGNTKLSKRMLKQIAKTIRWNRGR